MEIYKHSERIEKKFRAICNIRTSMLQDICREAKQDGVLFRTTSEGKNVKYLTQVNV